MSGIRRFGDAKRWADIVVHRGVAHWVEVAEDLALDARGQFAPVNGQIDATPRHAVGIRFHSASRSRTRAASGSPARETHGHIGTCRYTW